MQAVNEINKVESGVAANSRQQRGAIGESFRSQELVHAINLLADLVAYQRDAWAPAAAGDGSGVFYLQHCTIAVTGSCLKVGT
jgi:hypothetical protein